MEALSDSILLPPQVDQRGLMSRARNMQPDIWYTHGASGNVFPRSPAYSSTRSLRILNPWDDLAAGRIPARASTEPPAVESSSSTRNSINHMNGRNFKNYGVDQQRLPNPELHF